MLLREVSSKPLVTLLWYLRELCRDHEGMLKSHQNVDAALANFYASLETDR